MAFWTFETDLKSISQIFEKVKISFECKRKNNIGRQLFLQTELMVVLWIILEHYKTL